jgi:sarcosine oxidase subunit alpha
VSDLRLPDEPGAPGGTTVGFTFEGRVLEGRAGEPLAAALHAAGVQVLGRSFKYRRPRGLQCMTGSCPGCAMRVDGLPGVTTCQTPLRGGEVVERERGWPTADRDALAVLDRLSALAPNGFQYRRLRRSPKLWNAAEHVLARLAARGDLPDPEAAARLGGATLRVVEADVAVIGAGAAGMSAAAEAAAAGRDVVLVERAPASGGRLASRPELAALRSELAGAVQGTPGIHPLMGASAFAWYDPDAMLLAVEGGIAELRAARWVVATGGHPQPLVFEGNDLPGVLLGEAARRLLHGARVRPGRRAVVVTDSDLGVRTAADLGAAGVEVVAVADARGAANGTAPGQRLQGWGIRAAHGRGRVRAVTLEPASGGPSRRVACDLVCVEVGTAPADELLRQRLAEGGVVLEMPAPAEDGPAAEGVWAAGSAAGHREPAEAAEHGAAVGRAVAAG